MFDLKKLEMEWRKSGLTNKEVARIIGLTEQSMSRILKGNQRNGEINASQAAMICVEIGKPMDMFVTNNKEE